ALKAADLLVAESKIIAHGSGALELHFIDHVVGKRIETLSRGIRGPREVRIGLSLRHVLGAGESEASAFSLVPDNQPSRAIRMQRRDRARCRPCRARQPLGPCFWRQPGYRPCPRLSDRSCDRKA